MIEEKINNSLKELEQGLREIESARKQVEKTVSSYDGLTKTTGEYVTKLGSITTKVQELVDSIGKDYDQKVKAFEKTGIRLSMLLMPRQKSSPMPLKSSRIH